jgi:hypothetical protein
MKTIASQDSMDARLADPPQPATIYLPERLLDY